MQRDQQFFVALDIMERVLALHSEVTQVGAPAPGQSHWYDADVAAIRRRARALGAEALALSERTAVSGEWLGAVYVSAIVLDDLRQALDAKLPT